MSASARNRRSTGQQLLLSLLLIVVTAGIGSQFSIPLLAILLSLWPARHLGRIAVPARSLGTAEVADQVTVFPRHRLAPGCGCFAASAYLFGAMAVQTTTYSGEGTFIALAGAIVIGFVAWQSRREFLFRQQADVAAQTDSLTGLLNQQGFLKELASQLHTRRPIVVCVIDGDGFKAFNDRHGHLQGDDHLVAVAEAITQRPKFKGWAARWGGDEFAIAFPMEEQASLRERVAVFHQELNALPGEAELMTWSMGVAVEQVNDDARSLLDRADQALLRAKQQGTGQLVIDRSGPP